MKLILSTTKSDKIYIKNISSGFSVCSYTASPISHIWLRWQELQLSSTVHQKVLGLVSFLQNTVFSTTKLSRAQYNGLVSITYFCLLYVSKSQNVVLDQFDCLHTSSYLFFYCTFVWHKKEKLTLLNGFLYWKKTSLAKVHMLKFRLLILFEFKQGFKSLLFSSLYSQKSQTDKPTKKDLSLA